MVGSFRKICRVEGVWHNPFGCGQWACHLLVWLYGLNLCMIMSWYSSNIECQLRGSKSWKSTVLQQKSTGKKSLFSISRFIIIYSIYIIFIGQVWLFTCNWHWLTSRQYTIWCPNVVKLRALAAFFHGVLDEINDDCSNTERPGKCMSSVSLVWFLYSCATCFTQNVGICQLVDLKIHFLR